MIKQFMGWLTRKSPTPSLIVVERAKLEEARRENVRASLEADAHLRKLLNATLDSHKHQVSQNAKQP